MLLASGIMFEVPIAMAALARMGVASARLYRQQWRIAIVAMAAIAAILPGGDPISMVLLMIPQFVLYGVGIALAAKFGQAPLWRRVGPRRGVSPPRTTCPTAGRLRPWPAIGHVALSAWSGGRYMHFGVEIDEERLVALLRPDDAIHTVITADVYGQGGADRLVGRALAGLPRDDYALIGAVGHDFYDGERRGAKGYPRFTDPALRDRSGYADYLRRADRAQPGALRDGPLRPAPAPQPGPPRLQLRRGLARHGPACARRASPAPSASHPAPPTASRST